MFTFFFPFFFYQLRASLAQDLDIKSPEYYEFLMKAFYEICQRVCESHETLIFGYMSSLDEDTESSLEKLKAFSSAFGPKPTQSLVDKFQELTERICQLAEACSWVPSYFFFLPLISFIVVLSPFFSLTFLYFRCLFPQQSKPEYQPSFIRTLKPSTV